MFENEELKKTYVSVINGRFTVKVKEGEGTERITKSGKKVWEKSFDRMTGKITNVKKRTTEWEGKKIVSWDVKIEGDEGTAFLSLNYSSTEANAFLSILPNVDLNTDVTLNVFLFAAPGKKEKTYITIFQWGKKVNKFFTKENIPPMKKIFFKGEERWDDTDQQAVFEKKVNELFPPYQKEQQDNCDTEDTETQHDQQPNDDLPF